MFSLIWGFFAKRHLSTLLLVLYIEKRLVLAFFMTSLKSRSPLVTALNWIKSALVARAIKYVARQLVDMIPKIYDNERAVRLMAEDGAEQFVEIQDRAKLLRNRRKRFQGAVLTIQAAVQSRIFNRRGDTIGDQPHDAAVFFGVCPRPCALQIDYADQLSVRHHWHGKLAPDCIQCVQVAGILADILHQNRLAQLRGRA